MTFSVGGYISRRRGKAQRTDIRSRSVQPYSLSIWTHHLKGMKWFENGFTPQGCAKPIPGIALTVGSGTQWSEVYDVAKPRNIGFVGGKFSSVSVGGYLSNGGHSEMSAKYGLGADMVLQIELINAAGEYLIANECQNTDYFWAMRGVSHPSAHCLDIFLLTGTGRRIDLWGCFIIHLAGRTGGDGSTMDRRSERLGPHCPSPFPMDQSIHFRRDRIFLWIPRTVWTDQGSSGHAKLDVRGIESAH
jgi:hypothetical protein